MKKATQNGTDGRVYGGDCDLIHIADGKRADMGRELARELDVLMRNAAVESGARTPSQAFGEQDNEGRTITEPQPLCPGCYMIALFNAAVALAQANGQSLTELGASMTGAFARLGAGVSTLEEIAVILDAEPQS